MADNTKKTKIDLKARLGKTTQVGMGPPGVTPVPIGVPGTPPPPAPIPAAARPPPSDGVPRPPPSSAGSRPPMGIAPPPGSRRASRSRPSGRRPQPQAAPKPTAVQQTIKVEVGEEIHEERKKARNRAIMAAGAGVVLGIALGFGVGGAKADGDRVKAGAAMAGKLVKDVKAANDKLADLDKKLGDAQDKLKAKAFPDDLGSSLAGLKIPFDPSYIDKPGINGIKQALFRQLVSYARDCEKVDKLREALQGESTSAKASLTKTLEGGDDPHGELLRAPPGGREERRGGAGAEPDALRVEGRPARQVQGDPARGQQGSSRRRRSTSPPPRATSAAGTCGRSRSTRRARAASARTPSPSRASPAPSERCSRPCTGTTTRRIRSPAC